MTGQTPSNNRRDLLTTAALALTAGGALAALWPLISAMGPDAETRARRGQFALGELEPAGQALAAVADTPVLVFRRTAGELERLRRQAPGRPQDTRWQDTWHRSIRPEIMVCVAACPYDKCVVSRTLVYQGALLSCPCCASQFDLSGRRQKGPARHDLRVPDYHYISAGEIEFDTPG